MKCLEGRPHVGSRNGPLGLFRSIVGSTMQHGRGAPHVLDSEPSMSSWKEEGRCELDPSRSMAELISSYQFISVRKGCRIVWVNHYRLTNTFLCPLHHLQPNLTAFDSVCITSVAVSVTLCMLHVALYSCRLALAGFHSNPILTPPKLCKLMKRYCRECNFVWFTSKHQPTCTHFGASKRSLHHLTLKHVHNIQASVLLTWWWTQWKDDPRIPSYNFSATGDLSTSA